MKQGSQREKSKSHNWQIHTYLGFPENIHPGSWDLIASGIEETTERIHTMNQVKILGSGIQA